MDWNLLATPLGSLLFSCAQVRRVGLAPRGKPRLPKEHHGHWRFCLASLALDLSARKARVTDRKLEAHSGSQPSP